MDKVLSLLTGLAMLMLREQSAALKTYTQCPECTQLLCPGKITVIEVGHKVDVVETQLPRRAGMKQSRIAIAQVDVIVPDSDRCARQGIGTRRPRKTQKAVGFETSYLCRQRYVQENKKVCGQFLQLLL
ncbi:UNKNOWN [Stylonychia lemnae]|uniref:Secreted protein n=1 Tax=Stylonychia lemnae TaxID=5949 RepID=A0A078B787_STYLE|nr:UNKNOWN [Stylonychia lemnae]|eukprot:CDW90274.1 UNKNOWN [Stylonychia lemnae]